MSREAFLKGVFLDWWQELNDVEGGGKSPDRGELARLRRLGTTDYGSGNEPDVAQALTAGAFRQLHARIKPEPKGEADLVVAAYALAHIREHVPGVKTATLLGGPQDEDRRMKEARFLSLMRTQTSGDLFDQARRLVALLGRTAPVDELGYALYDWRRNPHIRRDWARAYYGLDTYGYEPTASVTDA